MIFCALANLLQLLGNYVVMNTHITLRSVARPPLIFIYRNNVTILHYTMQNAFLWSVLAKPGLDKGAEVIGTGDFRKWENSGFERARPLRHHLRKVKLFRYLLIIMVYRLIPSLSSAP